MHLSRTFTISSKVSSFEKIPLQTHHFQQLLRDIIPANPMPIRLSNHQPWFNVSSFLPSPWRLGPKGWKLAAEIGSPSAGGSIKGRTAHRHASGLPVGSNKIFFSGKRLARDSKFSTTAWITAFFFASSVDPCVVFRGAAKRTSMKMYLIKY